MSNKQTATSWLIERLCQRQLDGIYTSDRLDDVSGIIEQAKEMEKKQMIDFTDDYVDNCVIPNENMAIPTIKDVPQYYGEVYE